MKKNLLLLFTTIAMISPLASCGTMKPGINGNGQNENGENQNNNDNNDNQDNGEQEKENLEDKYKDAITVEEALTKCKSLEQGEASNVDYTCIGKVASEPHETYGNFDLEQGGKKILVYNDKEKWDALSTKPVIGDTVVVKGSLKNYFDKKGKQILEFYFPDILEVVGKDGVPSSKPQPATAALTKKGNGTASIDKKSGMSGDTVTITTSHTGENIYEVVTANGERIYKTNGKYTFRLKPGANTVEVNFVTYTPGEGRPDLFESIDVMTAGTRAGRDYEAQKQIDLGPVQEYYEPCRGLSGVALKNKLKEICHPVKTYSYDHLRYSFPHTDFTPGNTRYMTLMYTGEQYSISSFGGNWNYINREHVWPNSKGTGKSGPGSDKHMQRPCEKNINSTRSSHSFGIVHGGKELTGVNKGNKVGGGRFEPKDEFKGDTARIIFYIATVYSGFALDRPSDTNRFNYFPASNTHGVFDDLYNWATNPTIDPVSMLEMSRNNNVDFGYQRNRNPFIDHPEFIEMIYDKNYSGPGALN